MDSRKRRTTRSTSSKGRSGSGSKSGSVTKTAGVRDVRDNALERAEAMGTSDAEIEDVLSKQPKHLSRRHPKSEGLSKPKKPRPSTSSGTKRCGLVDESDGSGFDSDWDDEFQTSSTETTSGTNFERDIPVDDELDEPVREIITNVARGIDDEVDRLLGTSTDFDWQDNFQSFKGVPEQFSGPTPGPLKHYDSAYDAFVDIWDKDIIDHIVLKTNQHAQQTIEELKSKKALAKSSRMHRWVPTNADEIMVFFAILQFMGIDPRNTLEEYWTQGILCMPKFRTLMSLNRYVMLNKFIYFADHNPERDSSKMPLSGAIGSTKVLSRKLFKIAPIMEHLGSKFDSLYNLSPNIAIDESLTLFKGRLSWTQTIRTKAARFGIKSYELCESQTGYMARFQIYTGKDEVSTVRQDDDAVSLGLKSATIVLELLKGLEGRGHCLTMDNFYNCPSLARYLKTLGFDCFGTLRTNRRYVPDVIAKAPANLPRGTIIGRHSGDVSIVSWKDSRMVTIISTFHNADTYVGSRAGGQCVKPVSIKDYNTYMGGVDLKDQKLSMYLLERRRGIKWYMKIFKRLMNISILNSLVMYTCCRKRRGLPPGTHREFRYALAESIIAKHRASKPEIRRPVENLTRLNRDLVHTPAYFAGNEKRKRCRVCSARNKVRKLCHFCCVTCDAFMCPEKCWMVWHTYPDLKA